MRARPGELKATWSRREEDINFDWGGSGAGKPDGHMLYGAICCVVLVGGKTLMQELEARGYDLTTLRFSIRQKPAVIREDHP